MTGVLLAAAGEHVEAGGGAAAPGAVETPGVPVVPAAEQAPVPVVPAAADASEAAPVMKAEERAAMLDRIKNRFAGKGQLADSLATMQAAAKTATAQVETLKGQLAAVESERDDLANLLKEVEESLKESDAKLKPQQVAVADTLAELGVQEAEAPEAKGGPAGDDDLKSLRARLDKSTDAKEQHQLYQKIKKIRFGDSEED